MEFRGEPIGAMALLVHACARRSSMAARSLPVMTVTIVSSSADVTALIVGLLVTSAGASLCPASSGSRCTSRDGRIHPYCPTFCKKVSSEVQGTAGWRPAPGSGRSGRRALRRDRLDPQVDDVARHLPPDPQVVDVPPPPPQGPAAGRCPLPEQLAGDAPSHSPTERDQVGGY